MYSYPTTKEKQSSIKKGYKIYKHLSDERKRFLASLTECNVADNFLIPKSFRHSAQPAEKREKKKYFLHKNVRMNFPLNPQKWRKRAFY